MKREKLVLKILRKARNDDSKSAILNHFLAFDILFIVFRYGTGYTDFCFAALIIDC